MPTYTIRNKNKNEFFDTICTWGELEEFLDNNPQCRKVITAPAIVSGVQGRSFKTDGGFNEVMSKIADSHPNSPLADKVNKTDTIAQNKVRNVAKKHKLIDVGGQNLSKEFKKSKSTGLY
mgnify:CR=1 FL=1